MIYSPDVTLPRRNIIIIITFYMGLLAHSIMFSPVRQYNNDRIAAARVIIIIMIKLPVYYDSSRCGLIFICVCVSLRFGRGGRRDGPSTGDLVPYAHTRYIKTYKYSPTKKKKKLLDTTY